MFNLSAGTVITITLVVVVLVNVLIVLAVKNRKHTTSNKYKVINDFSRQIRDPFQKEEKAVKDLSNLIEKIKNETEVE
ncbi:MAG: hypothetical protein KAR20_06340 [Candidatus Heimdallarchaeota archaeon]|nr:hypothetical protein [Candidatus Heimdallarchaeota archaeon]